MHKTLTPILLVATALVTAGCAGTTAPNETGGKQADAKPAADQDAQTTGWRTTGSTLAAGVGDCPDKVTAQLSFDRDTVRGTIDHGDARTPVQGERQKDGSLVLTAREAAENAVRVLGFADTDAQAGQLNVTTYGPVCSYRVDIASR